MKVFKRSLAVLLSVLMLMGAFAVEANAADTPKLKSGAGTEFVGDFTIEYSGDHADIIAYAGSDSVLEIPEKLGGYTIRKIRSSVFSSNATLTKVTFEASSVLEEIEDQAFFGCTLLDEIQLPDTVSTMGSKVFKNCGALKKVNIPSSMTSVPANIFTNCDKLEKIIVPDGVTEIESGAFYGCSGLQSIVLPSSLDYVRDYAFEDCTGLKTVYFKDSSASWYYNVNVETGNTYLTSANMVYNYSGLEFNYIDNGIDTIEFTGYNGADETVTIPSTFAGYTVTELGKDFMKGNTTVKKVIISEGVKSIGERAFIDCSALEEVVFPTSFATIENNAFENCGAVTKVYYRGNEDQWNILSPNIGLGNEAINSAGKRVYNYTGLEFNYYVDTISGKAILTGYNGSDASILVPTLFDGHEVGGIDVDFLNGNNTVTSLTVSSGVESIGSYAFSGCHELKSVSLPEGLTSIGSFAFDDCIKLETVNIPSTVTTLGKNAFIDCKSLKTVEIPAGLTSIATCAFCNCDSLFDVTFNNGLTSIGEDAFLNCAFSQITLPETISSIGAHALGYSYNGVDYKKIGGFCIKGYAASYAKTYAELPENDFVFEDITPHDYDIQDLTGGKARIVKYNLTTYSDVIIPDKIDGKDVVEIADEAFAEHDEIKAVTIPASVTKIEDGAFASCKGLTVFIVDSSNTKFKTVDDNLYNKGGNKLVAYACGKTEESFTVSEGVVVIAKKAFSDADNLKMLTIPAGVENIHYGAFMGCDNLETVDMAEGVKTIDKYAFFGCDKLLEIKVPKSVDQIETEALGFYYDSVEAVDKKYAGFTIKCYTDSYAEFYAKSYGFNIEYLDAAESTAPLTTVPDTTADTTATDPTADTSATESTGTASGISYTFDSETGIMTVSGTGEISDNSDERPWNDKGLEDKVKKIVISDGITKIGDSAFTKFKEVEEVVISDSVKEIGTYAFSDCLKLKDVNFGNGVQKIGTGAFLDTAMTQAKLTANVTEISFLGLGYQTISESTSDLVKGFKIIAPAGSYAEEYAKDKGFDFVADGKVEPSEAAETTTSAEATTSATDTSTSSTDGTTAATETTTSAAAKRYTFTYLPSAEQTGNGNTFVLAIQDKNGNLHSYPLEKGTIKLDGTSVYSASVDIDYEPVLIMYQIYSGDSWVSQITKSANDLDKLSGEVITSDGIIYGSEKTSETEKPDDKVVKKPNPVKVTAVKKTVKAAKLKRTKVTVKPLKIKNAKGTVKVVKVKKGTTAKIYKLITVKAKNGAITIKKGKYAKKTFKVKLKITVKGNSEYSSKTLTKVVKIKIK